MDKSFFADLEEINDLLPRSDRVSIPKSTPVGDADFLGSQSNVNLALQLIQAYAARLKDALTLYLPLPGAASAFHASDARIRLVSGSNQAGKTLAAEAEFARLCRGKDPYNKRATGNLKTLAVGKDLAHIGQVMWRKLHWTGAFEILQDEETGLWRSVRPDPNNIQVIDPSDLKRKHLWMPAPPMIPLSDIANMAWESKGEGIPSVVYLKNGTEILFRTSNGKPPNGIQLDIIHFDEEITNQEWYPEMIPRLVRKGGIFYWSATPQAQTPQFYGLHRDFLNGDPDIAEFSLLIQDNPYFAPEDKEAMRRRLLAYGEDEYAVRWLGKYAIQGRAVYPTYDSRVHGVDLNFVPDDWMLVVAMDPGSKVAAFVIMAVPPDASCLYVVEECEVHNQDAEAIATELKKRLNGRVPEAIVFDKRAGIQHSIGRNDRVADHYAKAFKKVGVQEAVINPGFFVYGCDIPAAREMSTKNLLNAGKLKFRNERTSKLDLQIKNRYYDKANADRRETRTVHDLCDCYDAETEVLSAEGWKYFKDLRNGETLATVDLETDTIEYYAPSALIEKHYTGEMVKFGGEARQRIDLLVTPTHRMVVQKNASKVPSISPAESVNKSDRLKVAAKNWIGNEPQCPFDCDIADYAEFFGWFLSEGSIKKPRCPGHGYGVVISQRKPAGCAKIESLLSRLPFAWSKIKDGYQLSSNKRLWEILAPLGNSYAKYVPDWIRFASRRVQEAFLRGVVGGDGWTRKSGGFGYCSVSRRLADGIQEVALKCGYGASMARRKAVPYCIDGRSGDAVDQFHVFTRNNHLAGLCNHDDLAPNFKRVKYDGMVYCATVPTGTLIVRRNGKVAVCGNCLEYGAAFFDERGLYWNKPAPPKPLLSKYDQSIVDSLKAKKKKGWKLR